MAVRVYGWGSPPKPDTQPLHYQRVWAAVWRGELPAEVLPTKDKERLVAELWAAGWSDLEIACHTKWSTYTVTRLRERLGLSLDHSVVGRRTA
jgi:hypothetical protein